MRDIWKVFKAVCMLIQFNLSTKIPTILNIRYNQLKLHVRHTCQPFHIWKSETVRIKVPRYTTTVYFNEIENTQFSFLENTHSLTTRSVILWWLDPPYTSELLFMTTELLFLTTFVTVGNCLYDAWQGVQPRWRSRLERSATNSRIAGSNPAVDIYPVFFFFYFFFNQILLV